MVENHRVTKVQGVRKQVKNSKIYLMWFLVRSSTFLLKRIIDLLKLGICPER
jgi:hypothetical protein